MPEDVNPENMEVQPSTSKLYVILGNPIIQSLACVVIGLSVGWLVGISISPIIKTVITTLLTIVVAVISVLSGVKYIKAQGQLNFRIDAVPISLVLLGIAAGSTFGIFERTNSLLGVSPSRIKRVYSHLNLTDSACEAIAFNIEFEKPKLDTSLHGESESHSIFIATKAPVLFDIIGGTDCDRVRKARTVSEIRAVLYTCDNSTIQSLARNCKDSLELFKLAKQLCTSM